MAKRIVILGSGESGVGSAVLAKQKGFDVFVSDKGLINEKYKEELIKENILFEEGTHTEEKILNASEVISTRSPTLAWPFCHSTMPQATTPAVSVAVITACTRRICSM